MRTAADVGNAGLLKLEVLVVYEDFGTELRARRALRQTAQQLAMEADLHVNLWDFGHLRDPTKYEQTAQEAAEADILFVSAHGQDELPVRLMLWVERWLASKCGGPCALVMSLDGDTGDSPNVIQMLEALRGTARLAGVNFILHWGDPQTEWEPDPEDVQRRAETVAALSEVVPQQVEQPCSHLGVMKEATGLVGTVEGEAAKCAGSAIADC